ncbi:TolC family outer membrane protein [Novosphingobium sp.]|uniref:TolC family outer membrane protein n=1 Tax=Novosphingobium sp. TaxID=1874826 RepID=UPI0025F1DD0D|nr:TolC family outer membrane protein [Novosphingobium sp.]
MRLMRFALLAGMALAASPALADDLREALTMAYASNPQLQAARAQQRAVDEGVPIARSSSLPSVSAGATYTEFLHTSGSSPLAPDRNLGFNVDVGMPLYAGGAIKNSIRAARTRVAAGQADLRATESGVFSQVVAAYMDVITGQAVVNLNRSNTRALGVNLQATRDRFEIGDLTRTDVAQSQSRFALAGGQTRSAEAQLISARERYIQVVGKAPVALQPPPPLPGLPDSVDAAVQTALDSNPDLVAARTRSKAAGFDTAVAGSGRLPTISVFTGADRSDYLGSNGVPGAAQSSTSAVAGIRASIPLFQGGLPAAQRRQAQAREGATLEQEIGIEREVIAATRSAYASWQAATSLITSSQTAVDAAALSLEGVRAENTVGNRTILDILNAEQELLNAQVQLVTAKRNAYVAGFNLLSAMGKAEARDLGLDGGPLYDPVTNYDRVKNIIWDWQSDPAPKPQSTRTVDTPAQDGSVINP